MLNESIKQNFLDSVMTSQYNLLIGSGINMQSTNGSGVRMPNTDDLKDKISNYIKVNRKTDLRRAFNALKKDEKDEILINNLINCVPSSTLYLMPSYIWNRIFTFNVDDLIENLYANSEHSKQELKPINFDELSEPSPNKTILQIIHLHGWVHKPESGYVFSYIDYAEYIRNGSAWMQLLAHSMATEPFIISGASLEEGDLTYYLSHRSFKNPLKTRAPSLYINPNPDEIMQSECDRHGLYLIEATFEEFLEWLSKELSSPPQQFPEDFFKSSY